MSTYDYIVVGGGSAGCVVAGELANQGNTSVLLLEAGEPAESNPETLHADGYKKAFINNRLLWERFSTPQRGLNGNRVYLGSGRGLGGSGSVNAMVYTRGCEADFAQWNVPGWSWQDVVPFYERLEQRLDPHRRPPTAFTESCIAGACEAGFARKEDLNDGTLNGYLGYEWMNYAGDDRRSSYVVFVKPNLPKSNLHVRTSAQVRRILFDSARRAIGVEYEYHGQVVVARARHEVVMAAGALETPRLLMLSGVGPGAHLSSLDIPIVCDAPGVGSDLMDHPNVSLFFRGKQPTDCLYPQLYGFHRANPLSDLPPNQADTCYVFYPARSSFREGAIRMMPSMLLPFSLYRRPWIAEGMRALLKGVFAMRPVQNFVERMYGIVVILGKPKSRGTVRLQRPDAAAAAIINPNYFGVEEDLETLVHAAKLARRVAHSHALTEWGNRELIPGARTKSDDQLRKFIRKNVMTTYHYTSTCRMGANSDAPVTPRLMLRGVSNLRVVDASVIPIGQVSAMNAPSMLIGYRAAQMIAEDRAQRANVPPGLDSIAPN